MRERMSHVWIGRRFLPERYGQACRLLAARRGKFLLEFADGRQVATVRGTFRRMRATTEGRKESNSVASADSCSIPTAVSRDGTRSCHVT